MAKVIKLYGGGILFCFVVIFGLIFMTIENANSNYEPNSNTIELAYNN